MGLRASVRMNSESGIVPSAAIVVYQGRDIALAMLHPIVCEGGPPRLGAGKPMGPAALRSLQSKLKAQPVRRGVLPEAVLAVDERTLIWFEPPQMRTLHFRTSEQLTGRSIGTATVRAACPGVVFLVQDKAWCIWAYKGRTRPHAGTRLQRAPFFNVFRDGGVCAGNVRHPQSNAVSTIREWSDAFFNSYFTHANYTDIVACEGDLPAFWRDQAKAPSRKFPDKILREAGMTLGELVSREGL
ncbi:MAG TPA: PRTRC system protein B [Burkholderiaceae bacterium]|nr:PRTRC system protein B [Burkholderiaceae bacterium]